MFATPSWRRFLRDVAAPTSVTGRQLLRLSTPFGRSEPVRRNAASVIGARVQILSLLFAVLVPVFSIVDVLAFDGWPAAAMVLLRVMAAGAFLALAYLAGRTSSHSYSGALAMLLGMVMVPPLFYLGSLGVIGSVGESAGQQIVIDLYSLMPTLVLAGLAIFPLSMVEILLLALPVLGSAALGFLVSGEPLSWAQHGPTFWFMAMAIGIAVFSGMAQAHYMETLVYHAFTDTLTGVRTRRGGIESLVPMFAQAHDERRPLALAFFDIDHFKSINDRLGHDAGDQALQEFAARLRAGMRKGDILVRWGGEEFVAILPQLPAGQVNGFLKRLSAGGFGHSTDGQPLHASIGVAELQADGVADWQALVALADQRMYKAKHEGRGRAIVPGEDTLLL